MRAIVSSLVMLVLFGAAIAESRADTNVYSYGPRTVQGRTYWIYLQDYGGYAELWFRVAPNRCSRGDVKAMTIERRVQRIDPRQPLKDAARAFCFVKRIYDNGRTVAGCGSVALSGVCLAANAPFGESTAAVCTPTLAYALNGGFVDCVRGIRDWIGSKLAGDRDWAIIATAVNLRNRQWQDAISYAIDIACAGF